MDLTFPFSFAIIGTNTDKGGARMSENKKRRRGIGPARDSRITFNTMIEVSDRVQALADKHGWTVSKTMHLVSLRGLDVLEEEMEE